MIRIAISRGNTKLGNVPNINLPPGPGGSCRKDAPCWDSGVCYARKAWLQYPGTRKAWTRNWNLWNQNPTEYEKQIDWYLAKKQPNRFRWHSGGDIPEQSYFDMMVRLAQKHPKTNFLAFTKRYELNLEHQCSNLSILFSRWPGYEFPKHLESKAQAHFTNGNEVTGTGTTCSGSCKSCNMCWALGKHGKNFGNVLFLKH